MTTKCYRFTGSMRIEDVNSSSMKLMELLKTCNYAKLEHDA